MIDWSSEVVFPLAGLLVCTLDALYHPLIIFLKLPHVRAHVEQVCQKLLDACSRSVSLRLTNSVSHCHERRSALYLARALYQTHVLDFYFGWV